MPLESVFSALGSNPLLVGGVGTVAFGALMYVLRAVPQKLLDFVDRTFWTKLFVESLSDEFRDIDGFIESRRLSFFSRRSRSRTAP
jgi:chaperone BCS1